MKISTNSFRWAFQIALSVALTQGYSQSLPNRMNYQAVARDNAGNVLTSKPVRLKLEITDSAGTVSYYSESHAVTTNAQGLINLQIGGGAPIAGNYATIPWSAGRKYLRTSMDAAGGTNYLLLGSSELLSVPYALYALNAGGVAKNTLVPLKTIRDSLYKDFDGLGIGYRALEKLDTVAINVGNIAIGQGAGASLLNTGSVYTQNDNLLVGQFAGFSLGGNSVSGAYGNVILGNYAGQDINYEAYANVIVGDNAARFTQGSYNGKSQFIANLAIGTNAMAYTKDADANVAMGLDNMREALSVHKNVSIGGWSARYFIGDQNVILGAETVDGKGTKGNKNVIIGANAAKLIQGDRNVIIGSDAFPSGTTGSDNLFIGTAANSGAVVNNATAVGSGARVSTSNTMAFGNATTNKWVFGLATTSHALQVGSNTTNGNGAYLTVGGTWANASSRNFKENFQEISEEDLLERLRSLEITQWNYKGTEETHIGPMAEQFSDLFGLGVKGDRQHISTIDMSGVALRAIQALMNKNNMHERKIAQLEEKLAELEQRLLKLEKLSGQ